MPIVDVSLKKPIGTAETVAIHQPNFMPWLGYFSKMKQTDVFVLFDNVQFPRAKTFGNRVKIKTNNGDVWLTVPVRDKGNKELFKDIKIDYSQNWVRKTLKTITLAYQKAAYFDQYWEELQSIFTSEHIYLSDLNIELLKFFVRKFNMQTQLVRASELIDNDTSGAEKILAIVKTLEAKEYLSGTGAGSQRYIDEDEYSTNNIKLSFLSYQSRPYRQLWGSFIPNLSILDLLLNEGASGIEFI